MNLKTFFILLISTCFIFSSCKKDAGQGGDSFIRGKVYAYYYNKTLTAKLDSAFAPNVTVYIIYGNGVTFSDDQKTNYDGSYEFKYLKKGDYKIYAYSRDSTGASIGSVNTFSPDIAVIKNVTISKKKQTVEAPLITILKD